MMLHRIHLALALSVFFAVMTYGIPSKASTLTFCFKWNYSFADQGWGEDGLRHASGQAHGTINASYAWAYVVRNGSLVGLDTLNRGGCMQPIPRESGTYTLYLRPVADKPNGAFFDIQRTETSGIEYFTKTVYLPSGGDYTYTTAMGAAGDPVANAAAVAAQLVRESHIGLASGQDYKIFAQSSKDTQHVGGGTVHIGAANGPTGGPDAHWKFVIAHELGHGIQDHLVGGLSFSYSAHSSNAPRCRCDHVDTTFYSLARLHCLQSRETGGGRPE